MLLLPAFFEVLSTVNNNAYIIIIEAIYYIPTLKQPSTPHHETSRDDRLRIQTLYYDAKWTISDIILQTNLTRRQVEYALHYRSTL
jgi:hypothetical protein